MNLLIEGGRYGNVYVLAQDLICNLFVFFANTKLLFTQGIFNSDNLWLCIFIKFVEILTVFL